MIDSPRGDSYFADSNIWFYALNRSQDVAKHDTANRLLKYPGGWISTQVINEVCKNLIAKASFQEDQVAKIISAFYRRCRVIELNRDILLTASELRATYLFSFWDSLIVASALAANVEILYSEDMQDGLEVLNQLEVVNPFK